MKRVWVSVVAAASVVAGSLSASAQVPSKPDLQHQPTLYVAPYAHLDTEWIWGMPQSISEHMLKTMRLNFYYMDKYPHYVFNWTGSNRYRLMKEYFPSDYEKLKQYVAKGQWYPSGSSVEEPDMNLPSAESIVRQVLYGNEYFKKDFGKAPVDFQLPDCFGIPASVPEILAHAGLKGFVTGKLATHWSPSVDAGGPGSPEDTTLGTPFNIGLWVGPDGSTILAALNPGQYTGEVHSDLSKPPVKGGENPKGAHEKNWVTRLNLDGKVSGVYADFRYVGTGDIGGATNEETVRLLEAMVTHGTAVLPGPEKPVDSEATKSLGPQPPPEGTPVELGDGPVHVVEGGSDLIFKDITPDLQGRMPRYQGDLELTNHSAGVLTSQAYHKRWNRKNEILAGAAEEASVAAAWMGGRAYPQQRLNDAWTLVMSGQFHDVAGGTGSPRVYQYVQNDDVIALNQFAGVLTSATQSIASALDTDGAGVPVVVYNSLNVAREDVVEAAVPFSDAAVRVTGPDGKVVPAQMEGGKVLFVAKVPSVGYAVYHVEKGAGQSASELKVSASELENAHYRVKLDANGDVSSIWDKMLNKELLAAPVRLAISNDTPAKYPAWNMEFEQEQAAPRAYVGGAATMRIVENGPVRVAIEVTRKAEGSTFAQTVRLSTGDAGDRVEFADGVDWHTSAANLKVVFALTASNKMATYSWEVGTTERPTAYDRSFEVGTHHWIDLTDASGKFGATILTDTKDGSDKRTDNTVRLTLLRTPGIPPEEQGHPFSAQQNQDWGHHEILFGIAGHADGWREGESYWPAFRLSTPLESFVTEPHAGKLGRTFSITSISDPHVRLLALKNGEDSNDVIVRMVELDGKAAPKVQVKFAGPIVSAQAVDGQEQAKGPATVRDGVLETTFTPYQMQSFAVKLGAPPARLEAIKSVPVKLAYDLAASSADDTKSVGGFDAQGNALPAEMLPEAVDFGGVHFQLAPAGTGKLDAVIAKGQKVDLPAGDYNTVYVLAASDDGDRHTTFGLGSTAVQVPVEAWNGFVGQWDTRLWKPASADKKTDWAISANHAKWDITKTKGSSTTIVKYPEDYLGLEHGYMKLADIAWYASHHHTHDGLNEPYEYSYLFAYALKLPAGATTLTLPKDDKVRILAISAAKTEPEVTAAAPLYDTLGATEPAPWSATAQ